MSKDQARGEAIALRDFLRAKLPFPVFIESILVFSYPKATMHFGHALVDGVVVIGYRWLVDHIKFHVEKVVYTPEQIGQMAKAIFSM